jgi:hypothetical protein
VLGSYDLMQRLVAALGKLLGRPQVARCVLPPTPSPPSVRDHAFFAEGDRVVFRDGSDKARMSRPLRIDGKTEVFKGHLDHNDILRKPLARLWVPKHEGDRVSQRMRVSYPSLEEYISLTPRKVTPVRIQPLKKG